MTHKKIAELAHVSASTVSKALSGSLEVSEETAKRIRQIAIEYGYFKEKSRRKLEYSKNGELFIAILVPEVLGFNYSSKITYLKNQVEEKGGHVAVYIYDFDEEKCNKILESIILRGSTDGIIMFSEPEFSVTPDVPVICFSGKKIKGYDSISCDSNAVINDSVKYLKGLGHKDIGFIGEFYTMEVSNGFKKAMENNGLRYREDFVYIVNERFEAIGIAAAKKMLLQKEKPTAVIAAYDEVALSFINEIGKNGVKVPDDISVMGINNISSSEYAQIPMTTVEKFDAQQYKTAVDILFDKIFNETKIIQHITVEHRIIERSTTKSPKK